MKRIILIIDPETKGDELLTFNKIKKELGNKCNLIKISSDDPNEVLDQVLSAVRQFPPKCYKDIFVLFKGGQSFNLLGDNLPCNTLDLTLLLNKLIEVVGGSEIPEQRDLAGTLYSGAISGLLIE